jgi:hypothetical protein
MKIEKAMDVALVILIDHGDHQIRYDKLSFLFRQKLPSANSQVFDVAMESLKKSRCIAFGKGRQDADKVYLTLSGMQLYIDGGVYQTLLFEKAKRVFFALLVLTIGFTGYYLW